MTQQSCGYSTPALLPALPPPSASILEPQRQMLPDAPRPDVPTMTEPTVDLTKDATPAIKGPTTSMSIVADILKKEAASNPPEEPGITAGVQEPGITAVVPGTDAIVQATLAMLDKKTTKNKRNLNKVIQKTKTEY